MPKLIALYSPAPQSGKSTFADIAVHEFGFTCISFAKPLKDMLGRLLSNVYDDAMIHEFLYGTLKEYHLWDLGMHTPRELLYSLGTLWGRKTVCENLWIYLWQQQVFQALKAGVNVVTDDMRFPNELDAVWKIPGALPIKIIRDSAKVHSGKGSEGLLDAELFPLELMNNSSLEDYEIGVRGILSGAALVDQPRKVN